MILRVLSSQWTPFVNALRARHDVETAGIVLVERLHGGDVLFGRHFSLVPDDAYLVRKIDQIRIDPVALNRLVRRARNEGLSVLTVHTHPGTHQPWFSLADNRGDARLIPSLLTQMPGPHGSIVVAGETGKPIGRVWTGPETQGELSVRVVGQSIEVISSSQSSHGDSLWFDRQRLALGDDGQAKLRALHVGIVGLGGTGSASFVQLAHLGVDRMTIVDGDLIDGPNVSRGYGATKDDVGVTPKVDVAARYAKALGVGTIVRALRGHLGADIDAAELEGCDVIFSCVDRHTPRALLNRLAYEKGIPVIDMGSAFRVNGDGRVIANAGRVVVVGPERRCLACWGHIDPDLLRIEALSAVDRARAVAEGYIAGATVVQPSVIAFNTAVAASAVIELMRLVTGFAGADDPPMRLSFDFGSGTVRRNRLVGDTQCTICLSRLRSSHTPASRAS